MSKKNTGPLGPFTIKSARGETWAFDTLAEAAEEIRRSRIDMVDRPIGGGIWIGDVYIPDARRDFIMLDECGLIVPLWRIDEALAALPPLVKRFRRYDYCPEKDFRNGPLAVRRGRGRGSIYRHMRTAGERRAHVGLEADMRDPEDFPVKVKIRRRRKKIPTLWDDIILSRKGDNWKNYRRTRYK